MITRAKFQNFKALRDVEITFDSRLTVLVGPNGSGKTSVLQGMHFLLQQVASWHKDTDYQPANLPNYFSLGETTNTFLLELSGSGMSGSGYSITATREATDRLACKVDLESSTAPDWRGQVGYSDNKWRYQGWATPSVELVAKLDSSALVRFSATKLAEPTLVQEYPPHLGKDGLGLGATLAYLKLKEPDRFTEIEAAFKQVIPGVTGIRFDKDKVPPNAQYFGDVVLVDYKGTRGVRAAHNSSGTLFALGLLTVILGPNSPNIVLLDDLDHGLHPRAQMELIAVFRTLIEHNPNLQIIATSHSPYILSRLEWNEVRVTGFKDDGSVICARLEDHPEVDRWREAMTPGEFWSHIGDDWVKKLDKNMPEKPQPATAVP